jgi:NADPH:quinone reductase-like Zn-dependent oxidoreductase
MLGWNKPRVRIPGTVLAGDVVEVGAKITSFQPGDRVYGSNGKMGGYGEFVAWPEGGALARIPNNISYEQAAVVPYGALTALYFLQEAAGLKSGQKVLVNGASGGVGSYAVQIARHFGAAVTGVCSTRNIDFVRELGAEHVIDYTIQDPAKTGETYDVIFDVVVGKTSYKRFRKSLSPMGYYLAVAGGMGDMIQMIRTSFGKGRKVKFGGGNASEQPELMAILNTLLESGDLKPYIDKQFTFEEMVEAHQYTESGTRRSSVAVTLFD